MVGGRSETVMNRRFVGACQVDVRSARFFMLIECHRREPRSVWGAHALPRTPEWKYINVRRLFLFVEESIDKEPHWVVFEPNDEPL
jgi:hypothetical protein